MTLESISAKHIEDWLASLNTKPYTKQSNVSRLSALFSYHIRRDNITALVAVLPKASISPHSESTRNR